MRINFLSDVLLALVVSPLKACLMIRYVHFFLKQFKAVCLTPCSVQHHTIHRDHVSCMYRLDPCPFTRHSARYAYTSQYLEVLPRMDSM